jgi:alanine racemase
MERRRRPVKEEGMIRREFMSWLKAGALGSVLIPRGRPRTGTPDPAGYGYALVEGGPGGRGSQDPRIEVDLGLIGWNFNQVKRKSGVPIMAVVKANAYGHGLVETGKHLEGCGAEALMAGKLDEALRLRESGVRCPVLNFGPFGPADAGEIVGNGITQSVSGDDISLLEESAVRVGRTAFVDIHIDTGMNRSGVPWDKAWPCVEKAARLEHVKIRGVSTAFSEDPEFDREQLRRFLELCDRAKARGIDLGLRHAASSAALFSGSEFYLDMIRPGITLYGYYPNARTRKDDALGLRPALRLTGRVIFINDLAAGDTISYLRAYKAARPMRVATVGIGYSDGYPSGAGGKGIVRIGEKTYPVLPLVTSNHIMIDLGSDRSVRIGDEVVLIDNRKETGVAADALGGSTGVPDYRWLISLNPLTPRFYAPGLAPAGPALGR